MPDIDILNPHSSLCTPYEQYQEYLAYGEQVGSNFFAADADADAPVEIQQLGLGECTSGRAACRWAEEYGGPCASASCSGMY